MMKSIGMDETAKWNAIKNTRWVSDDGRDTYSGAKLAERLMKLGIAEDVQAAVDMLYGVARGQYVTTGVSAYTRTW